MIDLLKWFKKGNNDIPSDIPTERISIEPVQAYGDTGKGFDFNVVDPRFPRSMITTIERAVVFNPDLSHALELFVDLGNSGHKVTVVGPQKEEVEAELYQLAKMLNTDSIVNQLIAQIAIGGAISLEIVVKEDLSGIKSVNLVPVKDIYFKFNNETKDYDPFQWLGLQEPIPLNRNTYLYIPIMTLDGSPYAIPPFMAALGSVEVQEKFRVEMKSLAKKLGLLGFIDVTIPDLQKTPSETNKEYQDRNKEYLKNSAANIIENLSSGVIVHTEGTKIDFKDIGKSITGIESLMSYNDTWLISGAKLLPSLLSRSSGSTETWSTIAYRQFTSQLENYQRLLKRAIEYIYCMHILLANYDEHGITIDFNKALPPINPESDSISAKNNAEADSAYLDKQVMTVDEVRKKIGLEPLKGNIDEL